MQRVCLGGVDGPDDAFERWRRKRALEPVLTRSRRADPVVDAGRSNPAQYRNLSGAGTLGRNRVARFEAVDRDDALLELRPRFGSVMPANGDPLAGRQGAGFDPRVGELFPAA